MINFDHPDLQDEVSKDKTFRDLPLLSTLQEALNIIEYVRPTAVQFYSIPLGIQNNNLIVQSKSGTGKTLAFTSIFLNRLIGLLKEERIKSNNEPLNHPLQVRVLVLEPTRELAVQVYQFVRKILAAFKNVKSTDGDSRMAKQIVNSITVGLNIGGLPMEDDKKNYHESGFHIVVGTVGRVYELVSKKIVGLGSVNIVVMDEGDKLFEQNDTIRRMKAILKEVTDAQYLVYSATFSDRTFEELSRYGKFTFVKTVASGMEMNVQMTTDPTFKDIEGDEERLELCNIVKLRCLFPESDKSIFSQKLAKTKELLTTLPFKKCLLFVEKKAQIAQVCDYLKDFQPLMIHGSLSQSARIKMLNQLNDSKIIVTSDLLARGIDILVDLILLFNATEGENFWHRIGRTGRIGRKGLVITLDDIPSWQQYTLESAKAALGEVVFKPQRQMFGEYLTEIGRWIDVDRDKEAENINGYRYFDEEKFQEDCKQMLMLEEELEGDEHVKAAIETDSQIEVEEEVQIEPASSLLDGYENPHTHDNQTTPTIPESFNSKHEMQSYLRGLLSCQLCRQHMRLVESLTGYKFELWQYYN